MEETLNERIYHTLKSRDIESIKRLINETQAVEIAEVLEGFKKEEQLALFELLHIEISSEIFEEMDLDAQVELISSFKGHLATSMLSQLNTEDTVDIISEIRDEDAAAAEALLSSLGREDEENVRELLEYASDSAGGLMSLDFLSIPENLKVKEALIRIKQQDIPDKEITFYVYIVDKDGRLKGVTTLTKLFTANPDGIVRSMRDESLIYAYVDADQEELGRMITKYHFLAIPVVDEGEKLVGVVTADDLFEVVEEESSEDMLKIAGQTGGDPDVLLKGSVLASFKSRVPWMFVTIVGGILVSVIIQHFSEVVQHLGLLPFAMILMFSSLIAGLGGNVGSQSAVIIVRGLATGDFEPADIGKVLIKQVNCGIWIGLFFGSLIFIFSYFWLGKISLSITLLVAITLNLACSAFLGTIMPYLFHKFKYDPAAASGPFVTSMIDVTGALIYFFVTFIMLKITWNVIY